MPLRTIVSGGQSGVDRAALDVAQELGLASGGWCPAGRWADDGVIDSRYPLVETPSPDPAERTAWNVRDSDGTLILVGAEMSSGTERAAAEARRLGRPLYRWRCGTPADPDALARWVQVFRVAVLNVAGPRESEEPGIYLAAREQLLDFLRPLTTASGSGSQGA